MEPTRTDPAQLARTLRVMWAALLASTVVYVAIGLSGVAVAVEAGSGTPSEGLALLPGVFAALGLGLAVAAHLLWRRGAGAGRVVHAAAPEPGVVFTSHLLAWVLDEAVAILGLVLALLGFAPGLWLGWSVAAGLLFLIHRPRG